MQVLEIWLPQFAYDQSIEVPTHSKGKRYIDVATNTSNNPSIYNDIATRPFSLSLSLSHDSCTRDNLYYCLLNTDDDYRAAILARASFSRSRGFKSRGSWAFFPFFLSFSVYFLGTYTTSTEMTVHQIFFFFLS